MSGWGIGHVFFFFFFFCCTDIFSHGRNIKYCPIIVAPLLGILNTRGSNDILLIIMLDIVSHVLNTGETSPPIFLFNDSSLSWT